MTFCAAFRGFDTVNREDEDGTNRINLYLDTANVEDNSSYYQEIKFNGVTGAVDWVAGASWYSENAKQTSYVNAFTDSIDTLYYNLIGFPLFGVIGWSTLDGGKDWSAPSWHATPFDNHQPLQGLHAGAWGFIAGAVTLVIAGQFETPVDWAWVLPGCIGAGILAGVRLVAIPPHRAAR